MRTYYHPGGERAGRVLALFNRIAGRYDLINDVQSLGWHRVWKRRLVGRLEGRAGQTALDVCCGTGDVAFLLRRAGMSTMGLDFSRAMLGVARGREKVRGVGSGCFVAGDGMRLPLLEASVDLVSISYGLRNLADFEGGLREMYRVAKPGGLLGVLDFSKPRAGWWRSLYFAYLRLVVPVYGWCFCGDAMAYRYILESLEQYPDVAGVSRLMERAGWKVMVAEGLGGGVMGLHVACKE